MAVSDAPADDVPADVLFFVATARKILQRGANPLFDYPSDVDVAEVAPGQLLLAAAGPLTCGHSLDESIKLDSTYEQPFWDLIMDGHASLTRWLVPQPSYESLTDSEGDASRWADFLLCAP